MQYLGASLVHRLTNEWKEADLVDVWGFYTWGHSCTCPDCRSLGGSTDQLLVLISSLRLYIDEARANGKISCDVKLVFCGYEGDVQTDEAGTSSLDEPKK